MQGAGAFFCRFFLQNAQHLQGARFGIANDPHTVATRAGDMIAFGKRRAEALARKFQESETTDFADLYTGAIGTNRLFHALLDSALIFRVVHIDKVNDNQSTEVAQAHLTCHFIGCFAVGAKGRFLDIRPARGTG